MKELHNSGSAGNKLFRMVNLAENAGFGFDKIDENWKAYNSTLPDYQIEFDSVIIDFKLEADSGLGDRLGDNQIKILSQSAIKINIGNSLN